MQLTTEEHEVARLSQPNLPLKARVVFKFCSQGDGYWNNELFINQVKSEISIAEFKYPKEQNTIMFLLDQSSGHCAYVDDALHGCSQNECFRWWEIIIFKRHCMGWKTSKASY